MRITIEYGDCEEMEIVIRCNEEDPQLQAILSLLQDRTAKLTCYKDKKIYLVTPYDLYYAEVVDGKTFVYMQAMVLETNHSLSELEVQYKQSGLVRIGKSQLVNLYQVATLRSLPNSRIEITLKNGEKLIAARHYIQYLKEKLGM